MRLFEFWEATDCNEMVVFSLSRGGYHLTRGHENKIPKFVWEYKVLRYAKDLNGVMLVQINYEPIGYF